MMEDYEKKATPSLDSASGKEAELEERDGTNLADVHTLHRSLKARQISMIAVRLVLLPRGDTFVITRGLYRSSAAPLELD